MVPFSFTWKKPPKARRTANSLVSYIHIHWFGEVLLDVVSYIKNSKIFLGRKKFVIIFQRLIHKFNFPSLLKKVASHITDNIKPSYQRLYYHLWKNSHLSLWKSSPWINLRPLLHNVSLVFNKIEYKEASGTGFPSQVDHLPVGLFSNSSDSRMSPPVSDNNPSCYSLDLNVLQSPWVGGLVPKEALLGDGGPFKGRVLMGGLRSVGHALEGYSGLQPLPLPVFCFLTTWECHAGTIHCHHDVQCTNQSWTRASKIVS